jgi:hypothetical protein
MWQEAISTCTSCQISRWCEFCLPHLAFWQTSNCIYTPLLQMESRLRARNMWWEQSSTSKYESNPPPLEFQALAPISHACAACQGRSLKLKSGMSRLLLLLAPIRVKDFTIEEINLFYPHLIPNSLAACLGQKKLQNKGGFKDIFIFDYYIYPNIARCTFHAVATRSLKHSFILSLEHLKSHVHCCWWWPIFLPPLRVVVWA